MVHLQMYKKNPYGKKATIISISSGNVVGKIYWI